MAQAPRVDLGARQAMENSAGDVSPNRIVRTVGELDALWERAARIVAKQVPEALGTAAAEHGRMPMFFFLTWS